MGTSAWPVKSCNSGVTPLAGHWQAARGFKLLSKRRSLPKVLICRPAQVNEHLVLYCFSQETVHQIDYSCWELFCASTALAADLHFAGQCEWIQRGCHTLWTGQSVPISLASNHLFIPVIFTYLWWGIES